LIKNTPSATLLQDWEESSRLIESLIAVQVKKNILSTSVKMEQDDDFLTCIEFFQQGIDTTPTDSQKTKLSGMITLDIINCDVVDLEFGTKDQVQLFHALLRAQGVAATANIMVLEGEGHERVRSLNRKFPKVLMTKELFISSLILKVIIHEDQVSNAVGSLIFLLSFCLSRSNNFRSQNWTRRYTEVQRQLLMDNNLVISLSESSARELCSLIDAKIRDGILAGVLEAVSAMV
jgi:hypothetical protein